VPISEAIANSFKSEIRASGLKLVREEKVTLSSGTDTTVQAYVRASPPVKVLLTSMGVESASFVAACNCSSAKKSQFCKHVWAALLLTSEKYPDFLSAKHSVEKPVAPDENDPAPKERSYAEAAKIRASEYRKEQYRKQKAELKEKKNRLRGAEAAASRRFPEEVQASLDYFSANGFPMAGPDAEILGEAKRKLSRVFHPDKGGSHEETIELNRHYEVLSRFMRGD
jgi:hypothetical protein